MPWPTEALNDALIRHRGKLGGVLLGLLLRIGFFGPLLGLLVGIFWDEFRAERRINRGAELFFTNPTPETIQKIPAAERPGFLLMLIGRHYFFSLEPGRERRFTREDPFARSLRTCLGESRELRRGMERAMALPNQPLAHPEAPVEMAGALIEPEQKKEVVAVLYSLGPPGDGTAESRRFLQHLGRLWDVPLPREEDPGQAYHLLGLPRDAPVELVKQTFRTLAAQFHPDTAVHLSQTQKKESEEAFRKIRNAYENILKDKETG